MDKTYDVFVEQHRRLVEDNQRIKPGESGYALQEALNDALGLTVTMGVLRTESASDSALMRFFELEETEEDRAAYDAAYPEKAIAKKMLADYRRGMRTRKR